MYPLIMNKVFNQPWLILPDTHNAIQTALLNHENFNKKIMDNEEVKTLQKPFSQIKDLAIISVNGVIGKHLSNLEIMCGGCSVDHILTQLNIAMNDDSITQILLNINSPGGTSTGVYELGLIIEEYSKTKNIYAFTDDLCCSAAYWVASKCDRIIATPSATLGSIGVYIAWLDQSRRMEKEGVDLHLFKAGKFKAMGMKTPTTEEMKIFQNRVEELHELFKKEVNTKRSIEAEYMEGQSIDGDKSIEAGLADNLVLTFSECLELLLS